MLDMWIVILTLLLKAASLWFLAVALFGLRKPKRYAECAPRTRFACLVAARNEEAVIGALVESLKKQDYPDALYDIFVIPNNCTDDTESEALCAGAKIFRCFEPVRCKGDALHEAVAWLLPQRYDAFCVFDADNVADEQFLARMNDAFCAGAQVCKGAMRAKNPYDSWLSGCYGLYFTLFDTFFSRARMSCGLSSKLVGTGFAVHRAVLERFDYAINDCKLKPDWITALFINTGYAEQFERGNPAYVAGMSGVELARAVITKAYGPKELPAPTNAEDCSPEYWAGWAVAEYQWFTGRRFKDIFERIPLSKIIGMYSVYHEMDITSFIDTMEELYKAAEGDSNLKRIRENRGLSQAELAEQSGVNLRNIQMYEQRVNGIDKAQASILYKLSRVLGCNVEDLLENPMM